MASPKNHTIQDITSEHSSLAEAALASCERLSLEEPASSSAEIPSALRTTGLNNVADIPNPPQKASSHLLELPAEILDQILDCCEGNDPFEGSITIDHYPTNKDRPELKILRFVNKALNNLIIPRLYRTIVLYQHGGYWNNLQNIANHPVLAPFVEHIKVAHIGYAPQIPDFETWDARTLSKRGEGGDLFQHPPAGGPLALWDISAEAGWVRFQKWRDGELTMRNHEEANTAPPVSLHLLTNLKCIETIGLSALRTINRKPWMRRHGLWIQKRETRRYFETGLLDENSTYGFARGLPRFVPSTHLQTMMIALRTCGKDLNKLVLHRVEELAQINVPELGLLSLKHLVVDTTGVFFIDHDYRSWYAENYGGYPRVSPWILGLENLECLEIIQNPKAMDNPDMCKLLKGCKWPNLRRLELINLHTSIENLASFVSEHMEKLNYLRVLEPDMEKEEWAKLRAEITRQRWEGQGKRIHLSEDVHIDVRLRTVRALAPEAW